MIGWSNVPTIDPTLRTRIRRILSLRTDRVPNSWRDSVDSYWNLTAPPRSVYSGGMRGTQLGFVAMRFLWQFTVTCALAQTAHALRVELHLPILYSEAMVVQANSEIAIWGRAEAGESVTVSLAETRVVGTVDKTGRHPQRSRAESRTTSTTY
jgi:hypothetical protein